jgi:hypothetical protein
MSDVHTLLETIGTYLDHGYYQISPKRAGMLCKPVGGLPKPGYEKRVEWKGYALWVTRTPVGGQQVWSVYPQ